MVVGVLLRQCAVGAQLNLWISALAHSDAKIWDGARFPTSVAEDSASQPSQRTLTLARAPFFNVDCLRRHSPLRIFSAL